MKTRELIALKCTDIKEALIHEICCFLIIWCAAQKPLDIGTTVFIIVFVAVHNKQSADPISIDY